MRYTMTFIEDDYDRLVEHLFRSGREEAAYLLCAASTTPNETRLIVRTVIPVAEAEIDHSSATHMQIKQHSFLRAIKSAAGPAPRWPRSSSDWVLAGLSLPTGTCSRTRMSRAYTDRAFATPVPPRLRFSGVLPKPINPSILPKVLSAFCDGNQAQLLNLDGAGPHSALDLCAIDRRGKLTYLYRRSTDSDSDIIVDGARFVEKAELWLNETVKLREKALANYFRDKAMAAVEMNAKEPLLVVARRWNSWYPSFFNVDGGAYAVLGVPGPEGVPGVLIDPGFRALSVLRSIGIPLTWLNTCVITHNHPDHIGGVFEYITARHVLGASTELYGTMPVHAMLNTYSDFGIALRQFVSEQVDLIRPYDATDGARRTVRANPIITAHANVGTVEGTRGIHLSCEKRENPDIDPSCSSVIILGDTDYKSGSYHSDARVFEGIRRVCERTDLSVIVLHIGSCQIKRESSGKHLYLPGIIDLLGDIDYYRSRHIPNSTRHRLLVLISEWGLEHGTQRQILNSLPEAPTKSLMEAFGDDSVIVETVTTLRGRFKTLNLLPADSGLIVGMESGRIYLGGINGQAVHPDDISIAVGEYGLSYQRRHKKND